MSLLECVAENAAGGAAHTVAEIIKHVGFVDTATPNADHVLITVNEELEPCPIDRDVYSNKRCISLDV